MKLKSVVFHQGVKLWDGNLFNTVNEGQYKSLGIIDIELVDHLVMVTCSGQPETIVVPTTNMRHGSMCRKDEVEADPRPDLTQLPNKMPVEPEADITIEDKAVLAEFADKLKHKAEDMPVTATKDAKTQSEVPVPAFSADKYKGKQPEEKVKKPAKTKKA